MTYKFLNKSAIYFVCLTFLLALQSRPSLSQILKDEESVKLVKECVDHLYNLEFDKSDEIFSKIKQLHPDHPAVLLLDGIIVYWKEFPLITSSPSRARYEKDLRDCIARCNIKNPPDEAEYLLTNLCARGMLLLFYSDNGMSKEVIPLATNTYKYLRLAFDFTDTYPDFYYFTGLYSYYREAYPEAHPIYRPFVFIFPRGSKIRGLRELEIASTNAILLKAESSVFLTYIYQYFEDNPSRATYFSKSLHELYPENIEYMVDYIFNLLLEQKVEEAEKMMKKASSGVNNQYFKAALEILNGILQEKKYHNTDLAEKFYQDGIKDIGPYGNFANDYVACGYFGLSRLSAARNDEKGQKYYRKKAIDLTDFKKDHFADKE